MTTPVLEKPTAQRAAVGVVTLRDINWAGFKAIEASFAGVRSVKLSYLAGVLEIMSPIGRQHEYVKTTLGYLLEAYLREQGIRFYGCGGFTLETPGYSANEPDESYCIGSYKQTPDIVIEIIITSGGLNRLELYKPKAIPEVWIWQSGHLSIYLFQDGEYRETPRSRLLPDLDLALLQRCLDYPDQYEAVQAFQAAVRRGEPHQAD